MVNSFTFREILEESNMSCLTLVPLVAVGLLTLLLWRRYLSPLSDIPGPYAASFTRLWHMNRILKGDQSSELIRLHDRHGSASDGYMTRLLATC